MINIIKQEIEIEKGLKQRLEFICNFVRLQLLLLMVVFVKLINLICNM